MSAELSRRWLLLGGSAAAIVSSADAAYAQWVVIDPTNLAQNILQVAHAVEQIANQIEQIKQQARMLASSPLQMSEELASAIGEARSLLQSAEALSFEASRIGEEMRALYPETFDQFALQDVLSRTDDWLAQSRASLETAMRAEAHAAGATGRAQSAVDRALGASAEAEGQTGATQAGNQLLGVMATQLAELQVLIAAQGRALETERMERVARQERAGEIRRRAFPNQRRPVAPARTAF